MSQAQTDVQRPPEQDPKAQGPTPPFPEQPQSPPGLEAEMRPRPDYGEQTYKGSGRCASSAGWTSWSITRRSR